MSRLSRRRRRTTPRLWPHPKPVAPRRRPPSSSITAWKRRPPTAAYASLKFVLVPLLSRHRLPRSRSTPAQVLLMQVPGPHQLKVKSSEEGVWRSGRGKMESASFAGTMCRKPRFLFAFGATACSSAGVQVSAFHAQDLCRANWAASSCNAVPARDSRRPRQ